MAGTEVLTHTVGTKAWIKDAEEGWIKCDVVKVDPGLLTVKTERGDVLQAKPEECPLQNPLARAGVEVSC
jgi:Myosin N-terminal SH3-like domain